MTSDGTLDSGINRMSAGTPDSGTYRTSAGTPDAGTNRMSAGTPDAGTNRMAGAVRCPDELIDEGHLKSQERNDDKRKVTWGIQGFSETYLTWNGLPRRSSINHPSITQ